MLAILNLMHFCINLTINTSLKKIPLKNSGIILNLEANLRKLTSPNYELFQSKNVVIFPLIEVFFNFVSNPYSLDF